MTFVVFLFFFLICWVVSIQYESNIKLNRQCIFAPMQTHAISFWLVLSLYFIATELSPVGKYHNSFLPMWYNPIQSVASTSSFMSHVMTRFWPRFSVYSKVDAVSEDLLWEVTRSVSLLARGRPMGLLTTETVSMAAPPPLSARVRRFSGLRVCRRWGLRLRGADRWSRLPTERFGGLWERVLAGRTAVAREGRMLLHDLTGGGRLQAEA